MLGGQINYATSQSTQETSVLKASLRELNIEIVRLEDENDPLFRTRLKEELKAKTAEIEALEKTKPKDQEKPDGETSEQKELSKKINLLTVQLTQLKEKDQVTTDVIAQKKNRRQKLISLQQSLSSISAQITEQKQELKPVCEELGLDIDEIVTVGIKTGAIETQSLEVKTEITALEKDNEHQFSTGTNFNDFTSLPDLRAAYTYTKEQTSKLKEQLGTPQRKYQAYLDKFAKWTEQRLKLIGSEETPEPNTIKYLELQLSYIDNELSEKLSNTYRKRKEIIEKIFISKELILTFYSDLKESIESKLSDVRTTDFSVNINAAFVLDQSFSDSFLKLINKSKRGSFHGSNNPQRVLKDLLSEVDWNNFNSTYEFIEKILNKMKFYEKEEISIKEQVNDTKEFYDFLFSLRYFSPRYELRLGGKNLNELSPGEKGLLLLVFYLQLDKHNTPLIIDQPEDNLDNESVFTVLANCIRKAKENRQVILVTHNPNLAVGADAEQIIYVQLEKENNYKFTYESGPLADILF